MPLVVLGTNHKTAKLDLRERWSYQTIEVTTTLKHLSDKLDSQDIMLLSTCNRTEVYCDIPNPTSLINWFNEEVKPITKLDIEQHGYFYQDEEAVSHIMRVASGLDSLVLGEPQILGQFKQAYRLAQKANTVGKKFEKLFDKTVVAAKSVRTGTDIGLNAMSVASASVNLVLQEFSATKYDSENNSQTENKTFNSSNLKVLLIGSGDTIKTTGRTLIKKNITNISIVNRNPLHAYDLADDLKHYAQDKLNQEINVEIFDFALLNNIEKMSEHNVIFSATRSPVYLLTEDTVVKIANKAKRTTDSKLLLIDLAVPRDIEPSCNGIPSVNLYTVDDLEKILNSNVMQRRRAAIEAEEIIKRMASEFCTWESSILLMSSLCKYREEAELMCQDVISKAQRKIDAGQDPKQVIIYALELLRNKLTHHPTITLKNMAKLNSGLNSGLQSDSEIEDLKDLINM